MTKTLLLFLVPLFAHAGASAKLQEQSFACSQIAECAKCGKSVKGRVSESADENRLAFFGKCHSACEGTCEPDPEEGDPNEEL